MFDPSDPIINEKKFPKQDWSHNVYASGGVTLTEPVPRNTPESRGNDLIMRLFYDSDYAGDSVIRKLRRGFLMYVQNSLIHWYSKKKTSIETSSFGIEFMASKVATKYIRGLRYKLRMMGISIRDPCYIYGDNTSVLINTSQPDSTFKMKSNSIAFNWFREHTVQLEMSDYANNIALTDNHSDMQTKSLSYGEKRVNFCKMLLNHTYGEPEHVSRRSEKVCWM